MLTAPLVALLLTAPVLAGTLPAGAAVLGAKTVDECNLLTRKQAAVFMQVKPFDAGAPDNDGCSWQTDPSDRSNGFSFVTVTVLPLTKYLRDYPDVRTFLDESTTVGIDDLPGVGSEAYSTYSGFTGPGASDGITVPSASRSCRSATSGREDRESVAEFDRGGHREEMVAKLEA